MFDLDASKIIIVGVAALIFIPPKDLPRVMRQVGQFVGKMRRMANDFQGQFMDAMREADMADLRQEAQKLSDAARVDVGLDMVHARNRPGLPQAPDADVLHPSRTPEAMAAGQGSDFSPVTAQAPAVRTADSGPSKAEPEPARATPAKPAPEPQHTA